MKKPIVKYDQSGFLSDLEMQDLGEWWNPFSWFEPEVQTTVTQSAPTTANPYQFADKWLSQIWGSFSNDKPKEPRVSRYFEAPEDKVTVFADPEFSGKSMSMSPGAYDINTLSGSSLNDKISSIKIPPGMYVDLYLNPLTDDTNPSVRLTKSESWLKENGKYSSFEDKISAIRVYGSWTGEQESGFEPIPEQVAQKSKSLFVPVAVGGSVLLGAGLIYYLLKK